jgi:hypothetical protein
MNALLPEFQTKGDTMKKLWSLSILVLPVIVSLLCTTGCPPVDTTGSGSFMYDGATYTLTNGALENSGRGDFDVVLASSGLNAAQWKGTGYFVWLDLLSPSTVGAPGRYDWEGTDDYILWEGGVTFDYDTDTDKGNWIDADWEVAASEDHVTISVDGRAYTVEFSLTLIDGEVVTGSYTGPLPVVYVD